MSDTLERTPRRDHAAADRPPLRTIWLVVAGLVVLAVVGVVALEPWQGLTEARPDPFAGSGVSAEDRRAMDRVADDARPGREDPPGPDPVERGRDAFESRSGVRLDGGEATLVETSDGVRWLRVEGLDVDNGPGLRLVLSTAPADAPSAELATEAREVAELRVTDGDATYELPADVDPGAYRSVVIWSDDLGLPYAVAGLPGGTDGGSADE